MENKLVIKEYKIDYSFIIKNYLNPEMWEKTWTLFMYKNFVFTLKIDRIRCQDQEIIFEIKLEDVVNSKGYATDWCEYDCNYIKQEVCYNLKINDIKFLKNKINTAMKNATKYLEERKIKGTEEYKAIKRSEDREQETLREIAEAFLDDEGVRNDEIREAYIDCYIENNRTIQDRLNEVLESGQYRIFADLHLMLAELSEDDFLKKNVEWAIQDYVAFEKILEEVQEYIAELETEEKQEELRDNLESI